MYTELCRFFACLSKSAELLQLFFALVMKGREMGDIRDEAAASEL